MAAVGESRWPYIDSDRWPMTSLPEARRATNGEPQTGHRSPMGSPSLLYRRVLHVRHLRCGIGSLLLVVRSRQVCVAGIARTDRVCLGPGTARRPRAQASLGIDRRGNPAATRDREPARRADALPNPVASASSSPRLPIPLLEPRARKRARNPRAFNRIGTRPPGQWVTPAEQNTGPAVKTSNPRLSPRDAKRAVGGIRAWGENPGRRASSPTTVLRFAALAYPDGKKSAQTSPHESADPRPYALDGPRPFPPARAVATDAPRPNTRIGRPRRRRPTSVPTLALRRCCDSSATPLASMRSSMSTL